MRVTRRRIPPCSERTIDHQENECVSGRGGSDLDEGRQCGVYTFDCVGVAEICRKLQRKRSGAYSMRV